MGAVRQTRTLTINCPGNISTFTDSGKFTATVNSRTPVTADNCGSPTIKGVRRDGEPVSDPYPIGVTLITWTATDNGNTASCSQTITVLVPHRRRPF